MSVFVRTIKQLYEIVIALTRFTIKLSADIVSNNELEEYQPMHAFSIKSKCDKNPKGILLNHFEIDKKNHIIPHVQQNTKLRYNR